MFHKQIIQFPFGSPNKWPQKTSHFVLPDGTVIYFVYFMVEQKDWFWRFIHSGNHVCMGRCPLVSETERFLGQGSYGPSYPVGWVQEDRSGNSSCNAGSLVVCQYLLNMVHISRILLTIIGYKIYIWIVWFSLFKCRRSTVHWFYLIMWCLQKHTHCFHSFRLYHISVITAISDSTNNITKVADISTVMMKSLRDHTLVDQLWLWNCSHQLEPSPYSRGTLWMHQKGPAP